MAISAQRFKYLDKETNVATKDFSEYDNNDVYNNFEEMVDSALAEMQNAEELLEGMNDSIQELGEMLASASNEVTSMLKDALNSAVNAISNIPLPPIVKDIFNKLKDLDLPGVKGFFKDLLKVGSNFLCHNLDFLKMFMLGYSLNGNILGGLVIALLMNWLDRFCKGFTQEETQKANKLKKLEMVSAPTGMPIDASNVFSNFTNSYADYMEANRPIDLDTPMDEDAFLDRLYAGEIEPSMNNLRNSEISSTQKTSYLNKINTGLGLKAPNTPEYNNLLAAKGQLSRLPLINTQRREKNIKFSNLKDQLGSMAKNVAKIDVSNLAGFNIPEVERTLYGKISEFKKNALGSKDLSTRGLGAGSYRDFDFSTVMPALSTDEVSYVTNNSSTNNPHRVHGLHPTTEVFLEA